jgi:hypothetical protein
MTQSQQRLPNGRFQKTMDEITSNSPTAGIIREELENCVKRIRDRLNEPGVASLGCDIDWSNVEMELREAVACSFGTPVAKCLVSHIRKPGPWSGYIRDNKKRKFEELTISETGRYCIMILYSFF